MEGPFGGLASMGEVGRCREEITGTVPPHFNDTVVYFAILYSNLGRIMLRVI